MLIVAGHIEIDLQHRDRAVEAARAMMTASAKETGCIQYTISQSVERPEQFHIFERWADQAALDAHFRSPHMATFQQAIAGIIRAREIHKYSATTLDGPIAGGTT